MGSEMRRKEVTWRQGGETHTPIFRQIHFTRFRVIVKPEGRHAVQDILAVDCFALVREDFFCRFRAL
jgi:hypothetical protein